MLTFKGINLAAIQIPDAFTVNDRFLTVQVIYTDIDGDFQITPVQSLDNGQYDRIYDDKGQPIVFRICKRIRGNRLDSGHRAFNIDASMYMKSVQLEISKITSGKTGATKGTVDLYVMNSESVTTTAAPTTTA